MLDTLESLARAWDEDLEARRTLGDLDKAPVQREGGEKGGQAGQSRNMSNLLRHHRNLWGGKAGRVRPRRQRAEAVAEEVAESAYRPSATSPHSQRSARGTRERKVRIVSKAGITKKKKPLFGTEYKITLRSTGEGYIGITEQTFRDRMRGHKTKSNCHPETGCKKLNAKIHAHGWNAFEKKILYSNVPKEVLGAMERVMIGLHQTRSKNGGGGGMNLTDGGDKGGFSDPEVYARAQEKAKPAKAVAFASDAFKKKVGKESKRIWDELSPAEHQARAQKQSNGRHAEFVRRREAKIATLSYERGKYYWERQKRTCLGRIRRRMREFPERFVGLNPLQDCEEWFGRTFEERRRE